MNTVLFYNAIVTTLSIGTYHRSEYVFDVFILSSFIYLGSAFDEAAQSIRCHTYVKRAESIYILGVLYLFSH